MRQLSPSVSNYDLCNHNFHLPNTTIDKYGVTYIYFPTWTRWNTYCIISSDSPWRDKSSKWHQYTVIQKTFIKLSNRRAVRAQHFMNQISKLHADRTTSTRRTILLHLASLQQRVTTIPNTHTLCDTSAFGRFDVVHYFNLLHGTLYETCRDKNDVLWHSDGNLGKFIYSWGLRNMNVPIPVW